MGDKQQSQKSARDAFLSRCQTRAKCCDSMEVTCVAIFDRKRCLPTRSRTTTHLEQNSDKVVGWMFFGTFQEQKRKGISRVTVNGRHARPEATDPPWPYGCMKHPCWTSFHTCALATDPALSNARDSSDRHDKAARLSLTEECKTSKHP
jgi:hypothetical protein